MEKQIAKYRKIYKIFLILMLIGFIDSIIIPILLKDLGKDFGENIGVIVIFFSLIAGKVGAIVSLWFEMLWFVWGLIAVIANRLANRLQKKLSQETKD